MSTVHTPGSHAASEEAHVAALLSLPGMGPHRLQVLIDAAGGSPSLAWAAIVNTGEPGGPHGRDAVRSVRTQLRAADLRADAARLCGAWRQVARSLDPAVLERAHRSRGIELVARGTGRYPARLDGDPEQPALLFARGRLDALDAPTIAVVGTRRASRYGLTVAQRWGATFAEAGAAVVSGLASGIDAAAHGGALQVPGTRPVGVVGTGLDVVYPSSSRGLWREVAGSGLLLGESPLGTRAEPWRFPARNRIIAGLADVVLVVESHVRGGSLLTADEAVARGKAVFAVPGSLHSPASQGCHALIKDGAHLASSPDDVLAQMPRSGRPSAARRSAGAAPLPPPAGVASGGREPAGTSDPEVGALLEALGWEPATLEELVERTGWSLRTTSAVLERLLRSHQVTQVGRRFAQEGE